VVYFWWIEGCGSGVFFFIVFYFVVWVAFFIFYIFGIFVVGLLLLWLGFLGLVVCDDFGLFVFVFSDIGFGLGVF